MAGPSSLQATFHSAGETRVYLDNSGTDAHDLALRPAALQRAGAASWVPTGCWTRG